MIKIDKLKPFIFYKDTVVSRLKEGKDKFKGIFIALFSDEEESLESFSQNNSLKYIAMNIRGFYAPKFIKIPAVGKAGLRRARTPINLFKRVKKLPNHFIKTTSPNVTEMKGLSYIRLMDEEVKNWDLLKTDNRKKARLVSDWLRDISSENTESHPTSIMLLDGDNKASSDFLQYMFDNSHVLKLPDAWYGEFLVFSTKNKYIVRGSFEAKFKPRFQTAIKLIDKMRTGEEIPNQVLSFFSSENAEVDIDERKEMELKSVVETEDMREQVLAKLLPTLGITPGDKAPLSVTAIADVDNIVDQLSEKGGKKVSVEEVIEAVSSSNVFSGEIDKMKQSSKKEILAKRKQESMAAEQQEIEFELDGAKVKISDITKQVKDDGIDFFPIPDESISNPEMRNISSRNINSSYIKKLMRRDTVNILQSFSEDDSYPIYIQDLQIENTSDEFNKKETIRVVLKDAKGKKHTVRVDMPKMTDEGYMYLNGSKKFITKQFIAKPIFKRKPDEVQITTLYNKAFVNRKGQKVSSNIERLRKFFIQNSKSKSVNVKIGDAFKLNKASDNIFTYDELSKDFLEIKIGKTNFDFIVSRMHERLEKKHGEKFHKFESSNPNSTYLATSGTSVYVYMGPGGIYRHDFATNTTHNTGIGTLSDLIANLMDKEDPEKFKELSETVIGKRFSYSSIRLAGKATPVIIFLSFKDGLEKVLSKYGIKYEFLSKRKRLSPKEKFVTSVVTFKDGWLYYDSTIFKNSLLMNGLSLMPTKDYTFEDMSRNQAYLDFFDTEFSSRNIGKAFRNFWERMIDPITKELLDKMKIPSDFTGMVLYCNDLLNDNKSTSPTDVTGYRIRGPELVNQALYQVLVDGFNKYKVDSATSYNPKSIAIKQDAVIKKIIDSQNVESISLLSPMIELECVDK